MPTYYRFEHEKPRNGEKLTCFKTLQALKISVTASQLRNADADFSNMKFWKVEGTFVKEEDNEVLVRINSAMQIKTAL